MCFVSVIPSRYARNTTYYSWYLIGLRALYHIGLLENQGQDSLLLHYQRQNHPRRDQKPLLI